MNISDKTSSRKTYSTPTFQAIELDNEISLALNSLDIPEYDNESYLINPWATTNDPLKAKIV